jgi:hypothetical protein
MSNEEKILKKAKSILLTVRNTTDAQLKEVDKLLEQVSSSTEKRARTNKRSMRIAQFDDKTWRKPIIR